MNKIQLEGLERVVATSEQVEPQVGYDILLAACKRFLRANREGVCHTCGRVGAGEHYCMGESRLEWYRSNPKWSPWEGIDKSQIGAW